MRQGWNRGALIGVVIAIAVASGFLNQSQPVRAETHAASSVELTLSLAPLSLEVRTLCVALKIKV
ncbi:MAG: hypothetical protein H7124_01595 [Phycisphaerales bacterium]|nr:hypothetical protein [Hyphomonadaceae bacterium]